MNPPNTVVPTPPPPHSVFMPGLHRLALPVLVGALTACASAPPPGWTARAAFGETRAPAPGDDLARTMAAADFDLRSPDVEIDGAVLFPGLDHPLRDDQGSTWTLEVGRSFGSGPGAALIVAGAELGSITGYAEPNPDALLGAYLFLSYSMVMAAPIASWTSRLHDRLDLRLFGGPALFRLTMTQDRPSGTTRYHDWRAGAAAGAGASLRLFRGLSLDGRLTARFPLDSEVGPFTESDFEGNPAVLPGSDVSFRHTALQVGVAWTP